MKLYWCPPANRFARTQADAKKLAGGDFYEAVEIDTSQQALMERLNEMLAQIERVGEMVETGRAEPAEAPVEDDEELPAPPPPPKPVKSPKDGFCPTCSRTTTGHHWLKQGDIQTAVTEAIDQIDQPWALNNIADAIEERGKTLGLVPSPL